MKDSSKVGRILQIYSAGDRRVLELSVFKPIIEDDSFRRREVLEGIQQDDFETPGLSDLLAEIQHSIITEKDFDRLKFIDTITEISCEGLDLEGFWAIGVERLKHHRSDRIDYPLSDSGNAERFEDQHSPETKYDHKRGEWLLWDGQKWNCDETGQVIELMSTTLRGIYADVEGLSTKRQRKKAVSWARRCESRQKLSDALTLSQNKPRIAVVSSAFDSNPYLVNCTNGTLNLFNNHFRPHNHNDLITKSVSVPYNDAAKYNWWESFLKEIFDCDQELLAFIQRSAGYCLSGLIDEQYLWFLHGSGANGKSSFVKILSMVMGSYCQSAPPNMLLMKRGEGANNDIARLRGARFVTCQEIDSGRRLSESQVKLLTGGDRVSARFLYREWFEFEPTHKLWLIANHKPVIVGTDDAIWRRLLHIRFAKQIPEGRRRPLGELMASARKEASGILNWLVEGWAMYRTQGLGIPESVRNATRMYRDDSDTVGQFLTECCNEVGEVSSKEIFERYQDWAGSTAMSLRAFQETMKERGFELRVGRCKRRFWQGISLTESERVERVELDSEKSPSEGS